MHMIHLTECMRYTAGSVYDTPYPVYLCHEKQMSTLSTTEGEIASLVLKLSLVTLLPAYLLRKTIYSPCRYSKTGCSRVTIKKCRITLKDFSLILFMRKKLWFCFVLLMFCPIIILLFHKFLLNSCSDSFM